MLLGMVSDGHFMVRQGGVLRPHQTPGCWSEIFRADVVIPRQIGLT